MQHQIITPGPLLDGDGRLVQRGYAAGHILDYDPAFAGPFVSRLLNRLRLKEWDYYGVTGPDHFFAVSIADLGYMGLVFAYLIDFKSSKVVERSAAAPFGRGVRLPRSSVEGDVSFSPGGRSVSFRKRPGRRDISVRWPRFGKSGDLSAEISLSEPEGRRSIVMATLISDRRFYYNVKTPAMPAEGEVRLGSSAIRFTPADSFAVLDWGRGVWPYRTFWNWASAQGRLPDGRVFGLNLGQGFGDLSAATENCFFLDGAMHKLEGVEWRYERGKWLSPWMFEGDDGRTRLRMTPILDRSSSINLLVLKSEVHQVFGKWEGTLAAEGGSLLEFSGITGWAEAHEARW